MNNEIRYINIWESNLKDYFTYINNINELLEHFEKEKTYEFIIRKFHMPNENPQMLLDNISIKNNLCITYTNDEHNVTIYNQGELNKEIIINPTFFEKHKDTLIEYTKKKVLEKIETQPSYIVIPDFIISDELINLIVESNKLTKTFIHFTNNTNQLLTEEQIKKLKNAHLDVKYDNEKISTNKLIGYYTLDFLKTTKSINLNLNLSTEEIENFIYLNEEATIIFNKEIKNYNEQEYINNLSKIFKILEKHQRKYNIKIDIYNRELLRKSDILNISNINLIIQNDLYDYNKDEFLNEEEQLDKLIKPIKEANLSTYEKYLAVYNIVKQFKPYKENKDNKNESRYLRYILNNEYIVCVGFSKLLTTLLDKLNIPSMEILTDIDISYDEGFTQEDKPIEIAGHARNIIKIDDEKYHIHGIFIADSTWDNNMEYDLYQNAAITFDRKKEATRLETLTKYDLLLDFHNIEEFNQKVKFYLKKQFNNDKSNETPNIKLIKVYQNTFSQILEILSKLDYPKFIKLYNKYDSKINNPTYKSRENAKKYSEKPINTQKELNEFKEIFSNFLTEYANYILPLSNQKIDNSTLLEAAVNTKQTINQYTTEEKAKLKEALEQINEKASNAYFPYHYDPNESRQNYLTDINETKKR